ncbi:PPE family protein [Mycobacterium sherrisii]|uniref:PPE family protein n=1 Tax=Mycobacterium sherrisii TaxID=243061 RepID=UPI000A054CCF|nr:PPE family protein [Mycobacterium sherrisii]
MDFGALPPEINSARMYAGAGPGPMMAAAAAWDYLAAELSSSAASYSAVTAELTSSSWFGPASRSMLAAATPYISWLSAAAALAEQTSIQAKSVASAFDTAFAMTVPPPVIAENRAQLLALIATNILGQNTAAIAATEAAYAQMWAQDAAAMNGYAGLASTAAQLVPFAEPQQTTDQAGLTQQHAAVAAAATGTGAPSTPPASLTDLVNSLSSQVKGLLFGPLDVIYWPMVYAGSLIFLQMGALWPEHLVGAAAVGLAAPPALAAPVGLGGGLISASLASSTKVGSLSVPPGWSATTPTAAEHPIVHAINTGGVSGPSNGPEALLRQLAPARGRRDRGGLPPREYGFRPRFTVRPPSAG